MVLSDVDMVVFGSWLDWRKKLAVGFQWQHDAATASRGEFFFPMLA